MGNSSPLPPTLVIFNIRRSYILANLERSDPRTGWQKSLDFSHNPWTPPPPKLNMHACLQKVSSVLIKINVLCKTVFFHSYSSDVKKSAGL